MNYWRLSGTIEALSQLRSDLHDGIGRLITRCYQFAQNDLTCTDYWIAEAHYWEGQYAEAMKISEQMVNLAARGSIPNHLATIPAFSLPAFQTPVSRLSQILLGAFDEQELREVVKFELNEDLDAIAGGADLNERVFNLVTWAERTNRLSDLLAGAQRRNPTNIDLRIMNSGAHVFPRGGQ